MFKLSLLTLPLAGVLLSSGLSNAWGQAGPGISSSGADPADGAFPVARVVHRSTFAGYRGFAEQEIEDWRESNDKVLRIGGWRSYAQESRDSKPGAKIPAVPGAAVTDSAAVPGHNAPAAPSAEKPSGSNSSKVPSREKSDAHQQLH